MTDVLAYDPKRGLGPLDRVLVRGASAGKSPNELSEITNGTVTPAQAAARVLDILAQRKWLSGAQKRDLLLDDMMAVKDSLMSKAIDYHSLEHIKPLISVLTQIDKTLAAEKFDMQKAMAQIDAAHGQIMLAAISLALERSMLELEKRYPNIDKGELLEVFHAAMPDVVKQIEGRVGED